MSNSKHAAGSSSTLAATATSFTVGTVSIEVTRGELSAQWDVDALAILANPWLLPAGPAAQAVHHGAGKELAARCRSIAPVSSDDVVIVTEAFGLPNKALLHCREPVPRRHPMYVDDLSALYRRVLRTADERAIQSVALEPLGGAGRLDGVWSEAGFIVESIKGAAESLQHLRLLRFVLTEDSEMQLFRAELASLG